MPNFQLVREDEEIAELIAECAASKSKGLPTPYEQAVRATLVWLFYKSGKYPLDEFVPSIDYVKVEDGRDFNDGVER